MSRVHPARLLAAALLAAAAAGAGALAAQIGPASKAPSAADLYAENCSGCHGTVERSGGRAPNLFDPRLLAARSDEQLHRTVREGLPDTAMPAFKDVLSDHDSWRLVAFVRSQAAAIAPRPVFVPDPQGRIVGGGKQRARVEVVARSLDTPWGLAFLPDGRLLVTERAGRLRVIERGKLLLAPVKGTPKVWARQDAGLLDVVAHPDYARNGWIYLSYSDVVPGLQPVPPTDPGASAPSPPSMTVIVRGRLNRRNEWVDTKEIFRAPSALYTTDGSHYGSRMIFDRRGHLFYSIGERGVFANAQDLGNPLGKIHRVDADGSVPADNPFVGRAGALSSIWSYGHRNPQGLSWDPRTGLLWESEHGPNGGDEINIVEKGKNYGWGLATMGVQAGITAREARGTEPPVVYYSPRIAPSGIAFYSGSRYPGWKNNLFVAGLAGQQLRRLEVNGRRVAAQDVVFDQFGRTRAVATGPDGLLYILLQNPTGAGTGVGLTDPTPGIVIRLAPMP